MDIFQFAMEKEKYSQDYYRQLATKTDNKGLQRIFNMLADEEAKHYTVVEQMKSKAPEKVCDTNVLSDAKDIFKQMKEAADTSSFDAGQIETYKKAQEIEKDSREFYLQKADEVEDSRHAAIFRQLAQEESKHYFLLDNMIEFVSRPQRWLENAEFHHLEDY
ncbi:MAG: ferritin-like domain-containing protein [Planctomycetota bacterium]|jgi:rubrerythrin